MPGIFGMQRMKIFSCLLILMYWSLLLAWELGRKIRYPREESAYQTYSRVLGPSGALALLAVVHACSLTLGCYFLTSTGHAVVGLAVLLTAGLVAARDYARFAGGRFESGTRLQQTSERFAALVMLAAPVQLLLGRWVDHVLH